MNVRNDKSGLNGVRVRGGFSLIEVLIGIVVLALGLVGLAAVFPTVVRQQQVASDQSLGVSVAKSAIATIEKHAELSRPLADAMLKDRDNLALTTQSLDNTINPLNLVGWSVLTWDDEWSLDGSWQLPNEDDFATAAGQCTIDPDNGNCVIGRANGPLVQRMVNNVATDDPRRIRRGGVLIRTTDRLMPNAATPRFVWDFVVRRTDLGAKHFPAGAVNQNNMKTYRDDGVQVAVFVRRIDPGIRVGGGSLFGVLANGTSVPVAASPTNVPTLDGMGGNGATPRYSKILPLYFVFGSDNSGIRYDFLDLNGPDPALLPYAAQVGQRFVDQLGVVHKVVEVLDSGATGVRRVRLDAPMRSDYSTAAPQPNSAMELIFVPQVPASVEVFSTMPGDAS